MRYTKYHWLAVLLVISLFLSACNLGQEPEPTPDTGAIFTAAAETVLAEYSAGLTQTALAVPTATPLPSVTPIATFSVNSSPAAPTLPTSAAAQNTTPFPTFGIGTQSSVTTLATNTPLSGLAAQPTQGCFGAAFVADVTYPDGSVVEKDTFIAKVWSVQNTGTCTWDDGFSLQPVTGDAKGEWLIDQKKEFVEPDEIVEIRIDVKTPPTKQSEWGGCWRMRDDSGYYFGTFLCLLVSTE